MNNQEVNQELIQRAKLVFDLFKDNVIPATNARDNLKQVLSNARNIREENVILKLINKTYDVR